MVVIVAYSGVIIANVRMIVAYSELIIAYVVGIVAYGLMARKALLNNLSEASPTSMVNPPGSTVHW